MQWQNQQMRWAGCRDLVSRPSPLLEQASRQSHQCSSSFKVPKCLFCSVLGRDTQGKREFPFMGRGGARMPFRPPHSITLTPTNITCCLPHVLQREGLERLQNPEISRELEAPGVKRFYLAKKRWEKERKTEVSVTYFQQIIYLETHFVI